MIYPINRWIEHFDLPLLKEELSAMQTDGLLTPRGVGNILEAVEYFVVANPKIVESWEVQCWVDSPSVVRIALVPQPHPRPRVRRP